MVQRYNVVVPKKYMSRENVEKTQWLSVGSLIHFPANGEKAEGYKLELNMFPDTKLFVFEQKPREQVATVNTSTPTGDRGPTAVESGDIEYPEESINLDDIPF